MQVCCKVLMRFLTLCATHSRRHWRNRLAHSVSVSQSDCHGLHIWGVFMMQVGDMYLQLASVSLHLHHIDRCHSKQISAAALTARIRLQHHCRSCPAGHARSHLTHTPHHTPAVLSPRMPLGDCPHQRRTLVSPHSKCEGAKQRRAAVDPVPRGLR